MEFVRKTAGRPNKLSRAASDIGSSHSTAFGRTDGRSTSVSRQSELQPDDPTTRRLLGEIDRLGRVLEHLRAENAQLKARDLAREELVLWRICVALDRAGRPFPLPARYFRRFLKLILWTGTGQLARRWSAWQARKSLDLRPAARSGLPDIIADRVTRIHTHIKHEIAAARLPVAPPSGAGETGPKISIILPVYKTPINCLDQAIMSVRAQTYGNWELCICDDGSGNADITSLINSHARCDPRIKLSSLPANQGISAASNAALLLATGEFVGLLDHDDILLPAALARFAERIAADGDLDVLYSDEAKISEDGEPISIFTKPDWSPELLLAVMYLGHLTAYRRELVAAVGGFRTRYDFSQDYDLALRVTEHARKIGHVPEILYCWRAISQSAAAGGKPYARESNIAAATDALSRRKLNAVSVPLPYSNRYVFNPRAISDRVSIIIPSDSISNIKEAITSIRKSTAYGNYEIVVVTNSTLITALAGRPKYAAVKYAAYDEPFNFSDKCNVGAAAAGGDVLIFFNDDVRPLDDHWIEALLESLSIAGVAAAGPKLLYENRTIQHAGMVVGVRRLVGTAFHCLPDETGNHFNFAQSTRNVTLLSGACLAVRAPVFCDIRGFDAANTPISHSDVDLCLRIQESGHRCVYTPHARLLHVGHASIGWKSTDSLSQGRVPKDKSDIFLLRRWCNEISYDPFYPFPVRDLIYLDSPEPFQVFPPKYRNSSSGADILIIGHDLTRSGAPKVLYEMASVLRRSGHFVVVASPTDGPYRPLLQELGVPVIVDELLLKQHDSILDFAKNFDRVICNTVVTWPAVFQLSRFVDVYWYLHESELVSELARGEPLLRTAMVLAKSVWLGSTLAERAVEPYRAGTISLEYGLDPWPSTERLKPVQRGAEHPIVIVVPGSFEPRKGQDLALLSARDLLDKNPAKLEFRLFGRVLDDEFFAKVLDLAKEVPNVVIGGELTADEYVSEIENCDIVLVPSRDDTLPLVSLDALRAGKILICTPTVGTSDYLGKSDSAVVASSIEPSDISNAILDAIHRREEWPEIRREARKVFDLYFSKERFERRLLEYLDLSTVHDAGSRNPHL